MASTTREAHASEVPGPPALLTTQHERRLAVAHWLLTAATERTRTAADWEERGLLLLECGTLFSAIRVPADVVQRAAQSGDPQQVDAHLAVVLDGGPVIVDPVSQRYYALVPVSTVLRWNVSGTLRLGRGSALGVPYPDRTERRHGRPYWSVPMDSAADLCVPGLVARMVRAGRPRGAVQ